MSKNLKFVQSVWKNFLDNSGLEPTLLNGLKLTAATSGSVTFELEITKQHTNRLSILHGGTIASLVDLGGSLAVASKGLFATGVSTDLNVTYLSSGGEVGGKITGVVRCDRFGKTLAYTVAEFRDERGVCFARGSHTKFIQKAWEDERNRVAELSPREE